ncbi:MAG: LUD domain-containing protein [Rhodobacteraceae bacterium]|nr:LUD domain-containing protein [Paracoccaceae bacterium]
MSARDRILDRVRRQAGGSSARALQGVAQRLQSLEQTSPVPAIASTAGPDARLRQFIAEAEAVQASTTVLPDFSSLPAALAEELRRRNLGPTFRMGTEAAFTELDWTSLDLSQGKGRLREPATLSRAFLGVAEVGAVVLLSGPDNPVTLSFLGETHFIVLRASEIEPGFEGAWARLRSSGRESRTVNFIAGPSRTGDIELTLELGAHGPIALHIFVVQD